MIMIDISIGTKFGLLNLKKKYITNYLVFFTIWILCLKRLMRKFPKSIVLTS
jgi:hypothetical protein